MTFIAIFAQIKQTGKDKYYSSEKPGKPAKGRFSGGELPRRQRWNGNPTISAMGGKRAMGNRRCLSEICTLHLPI